MLRAPPNPDSFCKNHFGLQLSSNSLNSSGAVPEPAKYLFRLGKMNTFQIARGAGLACLLLLAPFAVSAGASKFTLLPETPAILDRIYSFDLYGALPAGNQLQNNHS